MESTVVTAVAEKERCEGQDYSDGLSEITAALAACREGNRSAEKQVLRLFFQVRTAYVESLSSMGQIRGRPGDTGRGITFHDGAVDASDGARRELAEFCQAFDAHPDVYRRLEPQLRAIVQATAKKSKNGSRKRQVSGHSDVIDWCRGKKNDRSVR